MYMEHSICAKSCWGNWNQDLYVSRFDVPDRLSGIACLQELNPNRTWNFIMVCLEPL